MQPSGMSFCHQSALWLHSLLHVTPSCIAFATNGSVYSWLKSVVSVQMQAALASQCHWEPHALSKCFFMINTRVSSSAPPRTVILSHKFTLKNMETWNLGWHQTKIPSFPTHYTLLFNLYNKTLSIQASQTVLQVNAISYDSTASFSQCLRSARSWLAEFCNTCESVYFIFWSHTTDWYPGEFNIFGEY